MKSLILILLISAGGAKALPTANLFPQNLVQKAAFEETYKRYPSPYGIIQQLRRIVPYGAIQNSECTYMSKESAPVTGVIDPLQGGALEEEPGALFYPYFEKCVRTAVSNGFSSEADLINIELEILGEELAEEIKVLLASGCTEKDYSKKPPFCWYGDGTRHMGFWSNGSFKDVPVKMHERLMLAFISYLVGPEPVLRNLNLIGADTAFGIPLENSQQLAQFLVREMLKAKNETSDLTLRDVYAETAILLRLGPALKH